MRDILAIILIIVIIVIIIKNLGMNLSCSCSLKHKNSTKQNFELPGTYEVPTAKVIEHQVLGKQEQSAGFPNFQARNWGVVVRQPQGGPTNLGPISIKQRESYQFPGTYEVPPSQPNVYATLGSTRGGMSDGRVINGFNLENKEDFEFPGTYEVPPSQPNVYATLGGTRGAMPDGRVIHSFNLEDKEEFELPGTYEVPPSQPAMYTTLGARDTAAGLSGLGLRREKFSIPAAVPNTKGFQSITASYTTDLNDQTTSYARVEQTRAKPVGEVYNDCYEYCVTNGDRPSVLYNFKNTAECAEKCFEAKYKM
jgi:hypothetical protein